MPKLIVGLGNPGVQYELNRHNIGFLIIDEIVDQNSIVLREKFKGIFGQTDIKGEKCFVLKPETFMNLSGESVRALATFYKIKIEDILVIHDEIDLDFGICVFKDGGGLAGHNGLKSIAQQMGGQNFKRLRVGVGRPSRGSVADFVLKDFSSEEKNFLTSLVIFANKAINCYIESGFKKASNLYNRKSVLGNDS